MLDGFDMVVLGVVLPVFLSGHVWGMTPATASMVSTSGLVGMMIGALAIGTVTDMIGRRKALVVSVAGFSLFTLACAAAPSLVVFGALRFLAGIGLGGCLPTAITRVAEHQAGRGKSAGATTIVMTGYHTGAVLTSLLGIVLIPAFGWRVMFVAGALPALVLVPLLLKYLPESPSFHLQAAAPGGSARAGRRAVLGLFQRGLLPTTLLLWAATFLGLLLVFGLNTWLPQIMRQAGYPLGTALALLLTLNAGAVAGMLVAGVLADRKGVRGAAIVWFVGAALFLAVLSVRLPAVGLYVVVFLAGFFVFSAQALIYAYTQRVYPAHAKATGLGWTAGVGRLGAITGPLLGGALLSAGIAYPWGFYVFALAGALAAVLLTSIRPRRNPATAPDVGAGVGLDGAVP
ncbi:MFS transporter [Nonomuraea sp. NPDC050451]|uniref:MFS transporter n=1 Tax=Nonomuraea sp. NPDC050451 TaxID=3364364 RepID=UPI0037BC1AB1